MLSSQPRAESVSGGLEPYYSNEDIVLLHEIVVTAEEILPRLPEHDRLPTNALFRAYSQSLKQRGQHLDHDNRFARILFKLGGLRQDGKLSQKLQTMLAEMGINLEYYDRATSPTTNNTEKIHALADGSSISSPASNGSIRNRPRRTKSTPSVANPNRAPPMFNNDVDSTRFIRRASSTSMRSSRALSLKTDIEAQVISQAADYGVPYTLEPAFYDVDHSFDGLSDSQAESNEPSEHPIRRWTRETNFDEATRLREDRLLDHHLRKWRLETRHLLDDFDHLSSLARSQDRKSLMHQALSRWRSATETTRFYRYLESRVKQARDYQSLCKAYSYWGQVTTEAVEKTVYARAHVLRTRYFNAWRDITTVNELKARRLILKKFFRRWKVQEQKIYDQEIGSVIHYHSSLAYRVLQRWLLNVREKQARIILSTKVKKQFFARLIFRKQQIQNAEQYVDELRAQKLVQMNWKFLRSGHRNQKELLAASAQFRNSALVGRSFLNWRSKSKILPAARQIHASIGRRLKEHVFQRWLQQTQQERLSTDINRVKMCQEVLLHWRNLLRCRAIQQRADRRMMRQSMEMWQLAEREILFKRNSELTSKLAVLKLMIELCTVSRTQKIQDTNLAEQFLSRKVQLTAFDSWHLQAGDKRQMSEVADATYRSRVLRDCVRHWAGSSGLLQLRAQEAERADYFLLIRKTMGKWTRAAKESKKARLKEAYKAMRRKQKIGLARNIILAWQYKTQMLSQAREKAEEIRGIKAMGQHAHLITLWQSKTSLYDNHYQEAISWNQQVLLEKLLRHWRLRSALLSQFHSEAAHYSRSNVLMVNLRIWAGTALQGKAQEHIALGLRERYRRKNVRRIFTFWQQQLPQINNDPPGFASEDDHEPESGSLTAREEFVSEEETELDIEEWQRQIYNAGNSIPGYLRTPSRRKSLFMSRTSSTTPMAPLPTPFERELRKQFDYGPVARVNSKRLNQSTLSQRGGFEDIRESP